MFQKWLSSPIAPLSSKVLSKYTTLTYNPDYSFPTLAYVLLKDRIENYSGIGGKYFNIKMQGILEDIKRIEENKTLHPETKTIPLFNYYYTAGINEFSDEHITELKGVMKDIGAEEFVNLERFVMQQTKRQHYFAFTKTENNTVYIISETSIGTVYHLTLSLMPILFRGLFKDKVLTKEEEKILEALTHKTPDAFIERISQHLAPLRIQLLTEELRGVFNGYHEARIARAKESVESNRQNAENYLHNYAMAIEKMREAIALYEGLKITETNNTDEENELIDYLVNNKNVHDIVYCDNSLQYSVATLLTNIDPQKFDTARRRNDIYNGYRFTEDSPFRDVQSRKLFLDALFADPNPEYYVRIRGKIMLNINRSWMDVERRASYDENNAELNSCLNNPHFDFHGCPGRNRDQIMECMRMNDLIAAVECSVAATGSVNIGETEITFRPFVQQLLSSKNKIIQVRKTGEKITPEEMLLRLLKAKKEEKNETDNAD